MGRLGHGELRPRRLPRHRRLHRGDAAGTISASRRGSGAARARRHRGHRLRHRLSLLPLQDRRPLLRAGDAGAVGGDAPASSSRCATRPAARSASRPTPRCTGQRLVALSRCSSPTSWCGSTSCSRSGSPACGSGRRSTAAWRASRCEAISQEEDAAASIGINVTRLKLRRHADLGADDLRRRRALRAVPGSTSIPDTVSGIGISLQMVFGVIAGGMYVRLGPDGGRGVHAAARRGPAPRVRQQAVPALDSTIYGVMLVLFIIYMPKGILGAARGWLAQDSFRSRAPRAPAPR